MKKFKHFIIVSILSVAATGCNWLDVDPELGLDDKTVFGTYANLASGVS